MELLALWKALEESRPVGPDEMHLKAKEKGKKSLPFGKFWNRASGPKSGRRFVDIVKPGFIEMKGDAFTNDYTYCHTGHV